MPVLTPEQQRLWEQLDRHAHAWDEGAQAVRNGLDHHACPYPWSPGQNTPRLRWMEGLLMEHERKFGSRDFQAKQYRDAQQAMKRDYLYANVRFGVSTWLIRLMRKAFS